MAASLDNLLASLLRPLEQPVVSDALRLFLILYGGLAAPALPLGVSQYLSNTFVRIGVCALVLWAAQRDVGLAVLMAAVYLASLTFATKKAIHHCAKTGKVTPEVQVIVTANSGPSIKPNDVVQAESQIMKDSVNYGQFSPALVVDSQPSSVGKLVIPESEYKVNPEAGYSSKGTPSAGGSMPLPLIPAAQTADISGAILSDETVPSIPSAYASDDVLRLADIPA